MRTSTETKEKRKRGSTSVSTSTRKKRRNTGASAPAPPPSTTIANIPNSVLIDSVFPFLSSFNAAKDAAKTLKITHGKQLQQQYVKTIKEPTGGCLEDLFRRYPFLPRTDPVGGQYIFVRPGIFDDFEQDCWPDYPIQIGRCCYRIDYTNGVIEQMLPTTPMTTRQHVEKWIRIVDGVTKTFSNYYVPYALLHFFYKRCITILSQSPHISLTVQDMSKLLEYLKRNMNVGVEKEKLRLVAFMILRLGDSMEDRIHYIRHHWKKVMNVFTTNTLDRKTTQRDLYIALLIFDPNFPPFTPQDIIQWNAVVLSMLDTAPLRTRKMLFHNFITSIRNAHGHWREAASFYVNDLLPMLIHKFPPRFESRSVYLMLFSLPPYPETVPLWITLYQHFSQHLTNGKKKWIFTKYLQNIMQVITEEQHDEDQEDMDEIKRDHVLQLYQELRDHGIEEEILQPVLTRFFHRHQLLPGNLKKIKSTLTTMGVY